MFGTGTRHPRYTNASANTTISYLDIIYFKSLHVTYISLLRAHIDYYLMLISCSPTDFYILLLVNVYLLPLI